MGQGNNTNGRLLLVLLELVSSCGYKQRTLGHSATLLLISGPVRLDEAGASDSERLVHKDLLWSYSHSSCHY